MKLKIKLIILLTVDGIALIGTIVAMIIVLKGALI